MRIDLVAHVDPNEWDELVASDVKATFFHTRAWMELIEATMPAWSGFHITGRNGGNLIAGIPAMRRSRPGHSVLASMPFGTFGGPIARPSAPRQAAPSLAGFFFRGARSPFVACASLVDISRRLEEAPPGTRRVADEMQILRLTRSYDDLWNSLKPSNRNKIRKAERAGISVRRAQGRDDFLAYHAVLVDCHERWGSRPEFGRAFFEGLSCLDSDVVQMWLAVHDGSVIAGLLNFALHGDVMNWGNVSLADAWPLSPNNLLHATAIENAVHEGCGIYNFGTSAGIPGVDRFKASFGTERVAISFYTLDKRWYRAAKAVRSRRSRQGRRGPSL